MSSLSDAETDTATDTEGVARLTTGERSDGLGDSAAHEAADLAGRAR